MMRVLPKIRHHQMKRDCRSDMMRPDTFPYKVPTDLICMQTGKERIPIFTICSRAFGTTTDKAMSKSRRTPDMLARHSARYFYHLLIKCYMEMERKGIGDHATIMHSTSVIYDLLNTKNVHKEVIRRLEMEFLAEVRRFDHRRKIITHRIKKCQSAK